MRPDVIEAAEEVFAVRLREFHHPIRESAVRGGKTLIMRPPDDAKHVAQVGPALHGGVNLECALEQPGRWGRVLLGAPGPFRNSCVQGSAR